MESKDEQIEKMAEIVAEIWRSGKEYSQSFDFYECSLRGRWVARLFNLATPSLNEKELRQYKISDERACELADTYHTSKDKVLAIGEGIITDILSLIQSYQGSDRPELKVLTETGEQLFSVSITRKEFLKLPMETRRRILSQEVDQAIIDKKEES